MWLLSNRVKFKKSIEFTVLKTYFCLDLIVDSTNREAVGFPSFLWQEADGKTTELQTSATAKKDDQENPESREGTKRHTPRGCLDISCFGS